MSAAAIRDLVTNTKQHLGALKNMNVPVQHWDLLILTVLQRKLDQYTLRAFHLFFILYSLLICKAMYIAIKVLH
jgi:hypothetical protein